MFQVVWRFNHGSKKVFKFFKDRVKCVRFFISMGKAGRVQKEKTNNLEEELMKVNKENARVIC